MVSCRANGESQTGKGRKLVWQEEDGRSAVAELVHCGGSRQEREWHPWEANRVLH